MTSQTRRSFLNASSVAVASGALLSHLDQVAKAQASERVRVGNMGAGGRAASLIASFAANKSVEVVVIADLDANRLPKGLESAEKLQGKMPRGESDFRKLIDDKSIDALVIGTPDHWHAIPTILACQAGKDVYVEKPDSHNIVEGMRMVAAMRKHKRVVQMGSQHRSTTRMQSAIEFVKTGKLGRCVVAKAWESSQQGALPVRPDGTPYNYLGESEGSALFGDQGFIVLGNSRWIAYGRGGEVLGKGEGDSHVNPHVQNFIECIKSRAKPYCDLETIGHPASVLCHAGNISARVGRKLTLDAATETLVGDAEANALRGRPEHRKPWVLPAV